MLKLCFIILSDQYANIIIFKSQLNYCYSQMICCRISNGLKILWVMFIFYYISIIRYVYQFLFSICSIKFIVIFSINMNHFFNKIKSNARKQHFFLYCYSFLIYGACINCIGPLIPYLSDRYSIKQTQYALFFTLRTLSYLIGAGIIRFLINKVQHHKILYLSSFFVFISSFLFLSESFKIQSISIFLVSMAYVLMDPVLNVLLLIFNEDQDKQFWVLIAHTLFSIGCLLGPILVYIFQLKIITFIGFASLLSSFWYIKLVSPEKIQTKSINRISQVSLNEKNFASQIFENKILKLKKLNNTAIFWIGIIFLFYIGQQVTFGGWISSYSVMTANASQAQASFLSSFFYIFIAFFKVIFLFTPAKSPSEQLKLILKLKICSSVILIFLQMFSPKLSCYVGCALYGMTLSSLYSKFLTFSGQFGYEISGQDYATIVIIASFGEAGLASVTGWLMSITPQIFYWCLLTIGIASFLIFSKTVLLLKHGEMQIYLLNKQEINQSTEKNQSKEQLRVYLNPSVECIESVKTKE